MIEFKLHFYVEARTPRWSARSLIDHQKLTAVGGKPKTRGRKKGEGDTRQPGILRPLLSLPLAKIDADRVRAWLKDEAECRPTQANNAFACVPSSIACLCIVEIESSPERLTSQRGVGTGQQTPRPNPDPP